jgi:phage terminase large subunit-like protein
VSVLLDWSVEDTIAADMLAVTDHAIEWARQSDPQREWLACTQRYALWRGGNSIGKSVAQAQDIVMTARGVHPYRHRPTGPVTIMVVGYSWAQMDPLLEKLWDYLPKDEIDPKCRYEPANGIRGFKEPVIPFVSGPGKGSEIRFATYEAGSGRIMGIQVDAAYLDEPPPADVYGEIIPRLNARNGYLRITFTPTPSSPPLDYLRKEIDEGRLWEMQTSLTPQAMTVRGGICAWPRMTPREIEETLSRYLEEQRPMREHGAWDMLPVGRWITTFSDANVIAHEPPEGSTLVVSIDHGLQAGKQTAILSWWQDAQSAQPTGGFLDEVVSDGTTTTEEDARHILEMLARNGFAYDHVDLWVGDRTTGENRALVSKSNTDLSAALASLLGRRRHQMRRIMTPTKFAGSVNSGAAMLKNGFKARRADGRPMLVVHPRCVAFAKALRTFKGGKQEGVKDVFDAGRYGAEHALRDAGRPEMLWRGVYA